jgi:hypothetical protein
MNFDTTLIRCSSLGVLFTEPQSKAEREAGELSKTAKSYLHEVYINEFWGREQDITTKEMDKGNLCEQAALDLLGFLDGKLYVKNTEPKENEWIKGHADVVNGHIVDVKCSWSPWSFIPKLTEPIDKGYFYQLMGYMWLWDMDQAQLSYCLINTPEFILQNERRKLLYSMNVATDLSPEYLKEVAKLERNHIFDDIPPEQRVISYKIDRDDEIIDQIPEKVKKAREYLSYLHKKHLNIQLRA